MKNNLLAIKRKFILNNAPSGVSHWNEDKNKITFFEINADPVEIKKPVWLKVIELLVYSKFSGNYKDNLILTCLAYVVFGLLLGFWIWWAV